MRRTILGTALLALACSAPAQAEWYFGAKTGPMMVDVSGVDDPTNLAVLAGYQVPVLIGDLGVEAEFGTTTSDGDIGGQAVEVDTQAAYLAFRTAGLLYLKAKAGVISSDLSPGGLGDDGSAESVGVGLGFGIGLFQIELEYTKVSDDLDFVSVGIQF